jgi:hypothetical protein
LAAPQNSLNVRTPTITSSKPSVEPFHPADPDRDPGDFLYVHHDGITTAPGSREWNSWSGLGFPPLFAIA